MIEKKFWSLNNWQLKFCLTYDDQNPFWVAICVVVESF